MANHLLSNKQSWAYRRPSSAFLLNLIRTIILISFMRRIIHVHSLTVAVFGGSGYIGRRVCRTLIESSHTFQSSTTPTPTTTVNSADETIHVISISRNGKPPSYYCNDEDKWSKSVDWRSFDLDKSWEDSSSSSSSDKNHQNLDLPPIDAAISCIGNVQPSQEWVGFFGLNFNNDLLLHENGVINQRAIELAKAAGAKRFAFVSVSYESAKCLEGPIEGYLDGKRLAESTACEAFGEENTILVGPSLVYGGNRFPIFGKLYRSFVESPPAKAYVAGNDFLRNLSSAPIEDWVEKMIFSSPVDVDTIARVLCAASVGLVNRDMVGSRRQDFYGIDGKPVLFPNALFVDGTSNIERVDSLVLPHLLGSVDMASTKYNTATKNTRASKEVQKEKEPIYEGALIGKKPYLYPFPVIFVLLLIFYSVATNQFVQVNL